MPAEPQHLTSDTLTIYDGHTGALLRVYGGVDADCDPDMATVCSSHGYCWPTSARVSEIVDQLTPSM